MKISRPLPHITQLLVPVPLPVHYTNSYVIDTENGYIIVDAGMDTAEARRVWEDFIADTKIDQATVRFIFITHFHPDHMGLAHWLSARLRAPIAMMGEEAQFAHNYAAHHQQSVERIREFYARHNVPDSLIDSWIALDRAFQETVTMPATIDPIQPEQTLRIGSMDLRFIEQGGHTGHQGLIYLPRQNVLVTGDQVLSRITPNVSVWPLGEKNPLASYLASLRRLLDLPHPLGLAAHEAIIPDVNRRVEQILEHHRQRNDKLIGLLSDSPKSAYELTRLLFQRPLDDYQVRFAIGETLAHLEFLKEEHQVGSTNHEGTLIYESLRPAVNQ